MRKSILCLAFAMAALSSWGQAQLHLIPAPVSVELGNGTANVQNTSIRIDQSYPHADGYTLVINEKGATVEAQSTAGAQYARETLAQLKEQYGDDVPQMTITDYPQYEWRGLMLDCSRHFYTIEYLKRQIDMLARYKMNRLHLHLTDDQGWRVEIKRYPLLTQQGAWREFNQQDSICMKDYADQPEFELDPRFIIHNGDKTLYGGYYTQEELRDLVKYAEERHVEIIPEVDMPGHTQAISAIYPQFTTTGEAQWGTVFSVPLSPAKEEVYEFLQNVLDEIIDIFPSKYIHIGADEVEKDTWKKDDACKALMEKEGLKDYNELQSYFVKRIQKYLKSKGREMICWDDALEGGLDKETDIMYWRYWVAGVAQKTVEAGHHVIFTPGNPMYIAHPESPLYDVYHFDGWDKVSPEYRHLVRGGQVSLWGESQSNYRRADYCIFPRMIALAERLWTPSEKADWLSFKKRLEVEKQWLEAHDILYGKTNSLLSAMQTTDLDNKQILVTFDSDFADPDIRYTLDGKTPTMKSLRFDGTPVAISKPTDIVAAIMDNGKPTEPMFVRHLEYHKAVGAKVEYVKGRWYESYKAGEVATFTDGKRGGNSYGDGLWQGLTNDFEVIVDLGKATDIREFSMRFMQDIDPGVFMPGKVDIAFSNDGKAFGPVTTISNDIPDTKHGVIIKDFQKKVKEKAQFVKVSVKLANPGFVFADEIVIR